jgi:Flp pilus assembly protein TadG
MYLRRAAQKPGRRATLAVEVAVVMIPCCLFIFAIMEYGRVVMVLQAMNNAARSGARQAVAMATSYISTGTATSDVQATINAALAGQNLKNITIQIYESDNNGNNIGAWTSAPFGQNIMVQIDADFPLALPTFNLLPNSGAAPNSMHITVRAMMRGEAN